MIPAFVAAMNALHVVPLEHSTTGLDVCVTLEPAELLAAVAVLDREKYLLEDVMVSDLAEGFEFVYHFCLITEPVRIALRLSVPHDAPNVPSISGIYPGADWHERECFDFYGVTFIGHPNLYPLLLPEDFEGHPLLKDPKARRSFNEVMPSSYLVACGLAEPDKAQTQSGQAGKTEDA